jgi:hypothetical protein
VLYNEPASRFGTSWGSEVRRNATVRGFLDHARDTGQTTLSTKGGCSGRTWRCPGTSSRSCSGLFVPVYRAGGPAPRADE